MMIQTKKKKMTKSTTRKKRVFTNKEYNAGDGMLTSSWGPAMWHYLHMMSFNYPVHPSAEDKVNYKQFILSLKNVLPCKYCRMNLKKNLKALPITSDVMKNRESFSKYIYQLHEHVNHMLNKKSGLSYCDVRERYEHFRARCVLDEKPKTIKNRFRETTEKGCTEPLYGKKSKCVIKIVPIEDKCNTFQMDEQCLKKRD
jgi:hypothetical protein